jgi:hypothetical protein
VVGSGDGAGEVGTDSTGVSKEGAGVGLGEGQNSSYTSLLLEPFPDLLPSSDDPLLDLPNHSSHTDSVGESLLPDFEPEPLPDFPSIDNESPDSVPEPDKDFPDLEPEPLLPLLPGKASVHVYSTHASAQNVSTGLDSDFPDLPKLLMDFPDLPDDPFPDLPKLMDFSDLPDWRSSYSLGGGGV